MAESAFLQVNKYGIKMFRACIALDLEENNTILPTEVIPTQCEKWLDSEWESHDRGFSTSEATNGKFCLQ
jgi:hypothetical protein